MKIIIENLSFETIIGILDFERTTPQTVLIDCRVEYCYTSEQFINYADVAGHIETTMHREQFCLIEEALETLAASLKKAFPLIRNLTLSIRKPDILRNCTVGVEENFIF